MKSAVKYDGFCLAAEGKDVIMFLYLFFMVFQEEKKDEKFGSHIYFAVFSHSL